jgi:hypothetical protein
VNAAVQEPDFESSLDDLRDVRLEEIAVPQRLGVMERIVPGDTVSAFNSAL